MSVPTGDTSAFFGGSIPSVKFSSTGDTVLGKVIERELRVQTDIDDPTITLYWDPDTRQRPKMQLVATLETHEPDETDENDTGLERLYIKGYMQNDFTNALRKARMRDLTPGTWVQVEFASEDAPKRRGMSGARHYKVEVWPANAPPVWAQNWPPKFETETATTEQPDEPPF